MLEFNQLKFIRDEVHGFHGVSKKPPGGIAKFLSRTGYALRLCCQEKEILVFAALQWTAIGIAYLLWVQMLDWIPEEVWRRAAKSEDTSIADWILLAWSFVCVGVAAYPIGILSGCMGAAHFLRRQGRESTIAACLKLVLPHSGPLWAFHWIDGWITVQQILYRLPRKRDTRTPAERARSEALYYAWKLGIAGVLPGILAGKDLIAAGKSSIVFLKDNFLEVAALRAGYSALCWVVGITSYVGAFFLFAVVDIAPPQEETYRHIYEFYLVAAAPILIAAGMVLLLLRPVYLLALCDLYADHVEKRGEAASLPPGPEKATSMLVAFAALCAFVGTVFIYRAELSYLLSIPYAGERVQHRDPDAQLQAAMKDFDAQRFSAAAAGFEHALRMKPGDGLTHARLGFSYLQMQRYEDAIPHLRRAVELDPSDHVTWSNLGVVHEKLGRPEGGIEALRTAAKLRPQNRDILINYGIVLTAAGRLDEALVPLLQAASLDPQDPAPRFHLAMVYAAKGDRAAWQKELAIVRQRDANLARQIEAEARFPVGVRLE